MFWDENVGYFAEVAFANFLLPKEALVVEIFICLLGEEQGPHTSNSSAVAARVDVENHWEVGHLSFANLQVSHHAMLSQVRFEKVVCFVPVIHVTSYVVGIDKDVEGALGVSRISATKEEDEFVG